MSEHIEKNKGATNTAKTSLLVLLFYPRAGLARNMLKVKFRVTSLLLVDEQLVDPVKLRSTAAAMSPTEEVKHLDAVPSRHSNDGQTPVT